MNLKMFFSKDYLKLRKTWGVWTVQYIHFEFCMQICSAVGTLDPPIGIGLRPFERFVHTINSMTNYKILQRISKFSNVGMYLVVNGK